MDSKLGAPLIWSKYAEHLARRNQLEVNQIKGCGEDLLFLQK